jgi:hypothetical protein
MRNKINISIDDVCPHPASSIAVVEQCHEIISKIPEVKFTIFVPTAYWRTIPAPPISMCQEPLRIDAFPEFCQKIRDLPSENFEIGYHGVFHGIPGVTNNDEFKSLNYEDAKTKILTMFELVKRAGLEDVFKPIFRPPAYRMSPDAIRAARDLGIKVLGLAPDKMYKDVYCGEENKKNDVVYYTSCPPIKDLEIFEKNEIVYHACEWDRNFLSKEKTDELLSFLSDKLENLEFCFIEDLL